MKKYRINKFVSLKIVELYTKTRLISNKRIKFFSIWLVRGALPLVGMILYPPPSSSGSEILTMIENDGL